MDETCRQAIALGIPAVAFTDHLDFTAWWPLSAALRPSAGAPGAPLVPPALDFDGYLDCVADCRRRYPDLRIQSGVEIGEPHWNRAVISPLVSGRGFDRVLGSLHSLRDSEARAFDVLGLYTEAKPHEVVRRYLGEAALLVEGSEDFSVLAHIDYPVRGWPTDGPLYDPGDFEQEYRHVLAALAGSGRALEINTRLPLRSELVSWWVDVGGESLSFGSDAHEPGVVGRGLREAAQLAEAHGFRPGSSATDLWWRRS
jgi:histidinol-phosphatase (PHP family)